jgi:hypothetical protein
VNATESRRGIRARRSRRDMDILRKNERYAWTCQRENRL